MSRRRSVEGHFEIGRRIRPRDHHPAFALLRRLDSPHLWELRAGRDAAVQLLDAGQERHGVEIPHRHCDGVVGSVKCPVMIPQLVTGHFLQVALVPEDLVVVRVYAERRGLNFLA